MKLTKFTISPSGQLVYKSTGKLAPAGYTFRKNTVYGPNGRRIGSLSRKITKKEAEKIARAERNRNKRIQAAQRKAQQGKPSKPSKGKPSKPSKTQRYGEGWDRFDETEFPEVDQSIKEEFAQRVRDAALSVAPPWLQSRIQAFTTAALWEAYNQDAYIFELYFKYHQPVDSPHKSDVSMWLYQFVTRVEQYMGVKV